MKKIRLLLIVLCLYGNDILGQYGIKLLPVVGKLQKKSFRVIFLIITLTGLFQNTLIYSQINIKLNPSLNYKISVDDIWNLSISNMSTSSFSVIIRGHFSDSLNQPVLDVTSKAFSVHPGTTMLSALDIQVQNIIYSNNAYRQIIASTGYFPAGKVNMCVELAAVGLNDIKSKDCREQGNFNFSPPELINPVDNAVLNDYRPVFTWSAPRPYLIGLDVKYQVKLCEILPGQSASEAMTINPPIYTEKDIPVNSIIYPVYAQELHEKVNYAWQIYAYNSEMQFGYTEIWAFTISDKAVKKKKPDDFSYAVPRKKLDGGFYTTNRYLPFMFDNALYNHDFQVSFFDDNNVEVTPKNLGLSRKYGDNRFVIDLKKYKAFRNEGFYYMHIRTVKDEQYILKFQYVKNNQ